MVRKSTSADVRVRRNDELQNVVFKISILTKEILHWYSIAFFLETTKSRNEVTLMRIATFLPSGRLHQMMRMACYIQFLNQTIINGLPKIALIGQRFAYLYTAVSTKVVQLKSIKAYATIPKGKMGCCCSLLRRQVHEFSARWKAVL